MANRDAELGQHRMHLIPVEMLMRVYARCVAGREDVWIARTDKTPHPEEDQ
jgi:hypothetical protein